MGGWPLKGWPGQCRYGRPLNGRGASRCARPSPTTRYNWPSSASPSSEPRSLHGRASSPTAYSRPRRRPRQRGKSPIAFMRCARCWCNGSWVASRPRWNCASSKRQRSRCNARPVRHHWRSRPPCSNRTQGNIETAAARQGQAETSMYVTQRTIERQVVEKALRYQTKRAEVGTWRPESVTEFRQAAALADRHYRLGAVPITTYVELQKQYLEAVEALLETQREALEAGQQLDLLTGLNIKAFPPSPSSKVGDSKGGASKGGASGKSSKRLRPVSHD